MQASRENAKGAFGCAFCNSKFFEVIKLIPECKSSICGHCYKELTDNLDQTRRFECRACKEWHLMANHGLKDDETLLRQLKPLEKLNSRVRDLQEKLTRLESFNAVEEINAHCDELMVQVHEAAESAIIHLNNLKDAMLGEIELYRTKLVSSPASTTTGPTQNELDKLRKDINAFIQNSSSFSAYQTQKQEMEYSLKLSLIEQQMKREMYSKQGLLKFSVNQSFSESESHLGKLVLRKSEPAQTEIPKMDEAPLLTITGHTGWIQSVIFLSENVLASCDKTIRIWNLEENKQLFSLESDDYVSTLALLPNGWLASGSDKSEIRIWDLRAKRLLKSLKGHSNSVFSLRVLPNGFLVSCSKDNTIKVWNPFSEDEKEQQIFSFERHGDEYKGIPMGVLSIGYFVTCTSDKMSEEMSELKIWNPHKKELTTTISTGAYDAQSLLVLSNDKIAVGFTGLIKIFDLINEQKSQNLLQCHESEIWSLAELPNGNLVSGGSRLDPTFKVWNLATYTLVQTVSTGHEWGVSSISLSPDGKLLATGSYDKTIKLYRTHQQLA